MANTKFKVAVCGAGVGGLTFAVAIAKYADIEVELYEATSEFSHVGVGIGIWPRVWNTLNSMGLQGMASKASFQPSSDTVHSFTFRRSDQSKGLHFYDMITRGPLLTFHRPDFQEFLVSQLPTSVRLYHSKRLRYYSRMSSGQIEIMFEDGKSTSCDILVGADGIKSSVRRKFLQDLAQQAVDNGNTAEAEDLLAAVAPIWTGGVAYRTLIPVEQLHEIVIPQYPTQYMGKDGTITVYPIAGGTLLNVAAFRTNYNLSNTPYDGPWVAEVELDELLSAFSVWEPEVQALLKRAERPTKWAIHSVKNLSTFTSDSVVLLGDAAHAMSPFQGSGAGQAIEDAYVLATLLGHSRTTIGNIPHVLAIYDVLRQPFTTDVAKRSFLNGRYFSLNHEDYDFNNCPPDEQPQKLKEMGDAIVENWKWAWSTSVDEMVERGVRMLENDVC